MLLPERKTFVSVQTVLILKYLVPGYNAYAYYGAANVGMNGGLMLRSVSTPTRYSSSSRRICLVVVVIVNIVLIRVGLGLHFSISSLILWIAQSSSDEYEYQLTV